MLSARSVSGWVALSVRKMEGFTYVADITSYGGVSTNALTVTRLPSSRDSRMGVLVHSSIDASSVNGSAIATWYVCSATAPSAIKRLTEFRTLKSRKLSLQRGAKGAMIISISRRHYKSNTIA